MFNKFIFLPIEIKSREFYPKLLLISELKKLGYYCVIGDKTGINYAMTILPKGVFMDKSISINKVNHLKKIREKAQYIVCMDEETGIAFENIEDFFKTRLNEKTLEITDQFYTYGINDFRYLKNKYPKYAHKFKLTGSCRIDLWNRNLANIVFSKQLKEIKTKYGNYILINTSFGVTSKSIVEFRLNQALEYKLINSSEIEETKKHLNQRLVYFYEFCKMVNKLVEQLPEKNFILRPHPSEKISDWVENLNHSKNLTITNDGIVTPWIINCDVLIHEGCTTAIEANIIGKRTIGFIGDSTLENYITRNKFPLTTCKIANNIGDIVSFINNIDSKTQINKEIQNRIYFDKNELAASKIAKSINELDVKKYFSFNQTMIFFKIKKITYHNYRILRQYMNLYNLNKILKIELPKKLKINNKKQTFNPKIPDGINKKEIKEFFNELKKSNSKEPNYKVMELTQNCFLIK